jgi:hypothetical protein
MSNLLPPESQKNILKEYRIRLTATSMAALFTITLFAIILLVPSFLLSSVKVKASEDQLNLVRNKDTEQVEKEMKSLIFQTNTDTALLEEGNVATEVVSDLFTYLLDTKPSSIAITGILYEKAKTDGIDTVSLRGIALNREALFSYTTFLQTSGYFTEATIPVSRFIKEKDIDFTIPMKMKSPDKQSTQP